MTLAWALEALLKANPLQAVALIIVTVVFLSCVVYPVYSYVVDPLDLRRYPAPGCGTAGVTRLWCAYQVHHLRRFKSVDQQHQVLGPVIRIEPNHLSFNVPEAAAQIYGHGSSLIKADFYEIFRSAAGEENVVGVRDKSEHARKRKMISAGFAMTNVIRMQPAIDIALGEMIEELDEVVHQRQDGVKTGAKQSSKAGIVNLRTWMNFLTFDMIGLAGYGESMGFVKQGNDVATSQDRSGRQLYHTKAIEAFHSVSVFESMLGLWPEYLPRSRRLLWWTRAQRNGTAFIDMCVNKARRRLGRGPPEAYKDLFGHYLTDRNNKELGLPFEELVTESNVILNAGSDTTATAMTNLLYLLMRDQTILHRLRAELDGAIAADTLIPTYDQVKGLPYLQACIEEGLRLRPPLSLGLPRKTVTMTNIAGHMIQPGVTVSVPTWSLHHNESLFPEASTFKPERWLAEDTENLKSYVTPFSQGPRACIGRNLAYLEQLVSIPTLVRRYDFILSQADWELPVLDRHVANPGDFPVTVRFRQREGSGQLSNSGC